MFSVKSADFHEELSGVFMDKTKRKLNIIAPRGHAKSSLVACVFVLYHILFDPGKKVVVLVSRTESHAVRLLDTIKNVLEFSAQFRSIFGYWGEHSAKVWKRTEVILRDGTLILTRGTGQQVVGLKHLDQRPTLIILDDPEDMQNTKTNEAMEFNLKWLLQSLVPSWDALSGRVIVIGTPQHQRCMVETLQGTKGWTTLRYQALNGSPGSYKALWPEMWSVEKLLEEKASLESINRVSSFYREFQCQIISDDTQLIKESYLRTYSGFVTFQDRSDAILHLTRRDKHDLPVEELIPINTFIGVDPATSLSETADYTAIVPIGIAANRDIYILPYVRRRMPPSETIEKIKEQLTRWKPRRISIETVAAQDTFRDILRRTEGVVAAGLGEKNHPREKKAKRYLEVLEPHFFKRRVFLMEDMDEMREELLQFGSTAKHDDLLDGLYWALKKHYPPHHGVKGESEKIIDSFAESVQNNWATS